MNTTLISNITSLQGMTYYTNNATDGILFIGGIVALFFVMLIVLSRTMNNGWGALASSSWIAFILSVFCWFAKLVPTAEVIVFLIVTVVATVLMFSDK